MGDDVVVAYRTACLASAMVFVVALIVATSTGAYDHPVVWVVGAVSIFGTITTAVGAIYAAHRQNGKYLGRPR